MRFSPRSPIARGLLALGLVLLFMLMPPVPAPALAQEYVFSVEVVGPSGTYIDLEFDPQGDPAMSYVGVLDPGLKFSRWTGDAWQTEVVSSQAFPQATSLGFDRDGKPWIAFVALQGSNLELRVARKGVTGWDITVLDGAIGSSNASLAFDRHGGTAIAYFARGDRELRLARWDGLEWQVGVVESVSGWGMYTSLAFDGDRNPAIAYFTTGDYDLGFARWTGVTWDIQTVDNIGDVGRYPSLAFDPQGNPAISYVGDYGTYLKLARLGGSGWQTQVVDTSDIDFWGTSLGFDASGNPAIAYATYSTDVRFAQWTGTGWARQTVDGPEQNDSPSLAFDQASNPAIVYRGLGDYLLKLAYSRPPPAPSPLQPALGEEIEVLPTLDWSDTTGAASYALQVEDDRDFSSPLLVRSDLAESQYTLASGDLPPGGTYFWRVRATTPSGATRWSDAGFFHLVTPAIGVPMPISPPDGTETIDPSPTLEWDTPGAPGLTYDLMVDDRVDFQTPSHSLTGLGSSSYTLTEPEALPPGNYFWRIRARDDTGLVGRWSPASAIAVLDTTLSLLAPTDRSSTASPTPHFDWSDAPDIAAATYDLQVDAAGDFSSPVILQWGLTVSEYSPGVDESLAEGTYYWRVRGSTSEGAGNWSATWQLVVDMTPPGAPELVAPAPDSLIGSRNPTFDWSDVADLSEVSYSLDIDDSADFASPVVSKTGLSGSQLTLAAPDSLPDGSYYWRVRGTNGAGLAGPWSQPASLTIDGPPPVPTLLLPADGASTDDPTPLFDWSDVSDPSGVTYRLQIDLTMSFETPFVDKRALTASELILPAGEALGNGRRFWRVGASDGAGHTSWAEGFAITMVWTPPPRPDLLAPATYSAIATSMPVLDWSDVTDPSGITYTIEVYRPYVPEPLIRHDSLVQSEYALGPGEALADGSYVWRVQVTDGEGRTGPWIVAPFVVDTTPPATPNPIYPQEGAAVPGVDPTLRWSGELTGVSFYQVQVDDDPAFSSPIVDRRVLSTEADIHYRDGIGYGTYYWRVKAVDDAGNESSWTSPRSLTLHLYAPLVVSPTGAAEIPNGSPTLRWSNPNGLSWYTYSLEIDDDADFRSPALARTGIDGLEYALGPDEALARSTYYWRVKAEDGRGSPALWAVPGSFRVTVTTVLDHSFSLHTVDSAGDVGAFTSIKFDPAGNPAIGYWDIGNNDLKFARWDGATWNVETVDSAGDVGMFLSLAFDQAGNPALSYYDAGSKDLKLARRSNAGWALQVIDSEGDVGIFTSLAFDDKGRPSVGYAHADEGDLRFARWSGTGWDIQNVDTAGQVGAFASLAYDGEGNPAISYWDLTNGNLKLARWSSTAWALQIVDVTGDEAIFWTSLAFDRYGLPAISYMDTTRLDLKLARWNGVGWNIQTVDSEGDVGMTSSLAFDPDGNPAIAHYDYTNRDLKFARWTNNAWAIETVDSEGDVGASPSFAFDPLGNPAISYFDAVAFDLKLAYNFPPPAPTLVPQGAGQSYGRTPALDWSDVSDPSGPVTYRLQIDDNAGFSSLQMDRAGLTASDYTLAPEEALSEGTYSWRVRAVDGGGSVGGWSAASTFFVDATPPATPALLSPTAGAFVNDPAPVLRWSDVSDPSGVSYSLEVDDNPDFTSPASTRTGLDLSEHALAAGEALPEGAHYWRVKAIDGAGNESDWAASWSLNVDLGAPGVTSLLSPPSGQKITGSTPLLEWSAMSDPAGVSYKLQIDDDADFSSPLANLSRLASPRYELPEPLAAGTYYWRVQAVDGAGNEGAWTEASTLQIVNKLPLSMIAVGIAALLGVIAAPALLRSRRRAAGRKRSVMV